MSIETVNDLYDEYLDKRYPNRITRRTSGMGGPGWITHAIVWMGAVQLDSPDPNVSLMTRSDGGRTLCGITFQFGAWGIDRYYHRFSWGMFQTPPATTGYSPYWRITCRRCLQSIVRVEKSSRKKAEKEV